MPLQESVAHPLTTPLALQMPEVLGYYPNPNPQH